MPRPAAPRKPAKWVGHRKLVVPYDGPLAGRSYFLEDWQLMRAAAEHTAPSRAAAGHPPAEVLGYAETRKLVDHPTEPAVGTAWRYTADDATRARMPRGARR